jgi:hypothetical protein
VHNASRSAGRYWAIRTARTSRSSTDAGMGAPCRMESTSISPSMPRRGVPMPCHRGRKRASESDSTGSTSFRRAASDRRLSRRRTSLSHHSRSVPSGRNSPRVIRPDVSSRSSAS